MTTKREAVLDWAITVPPPEIHACDCGYCEMNGDLEDPVWPMLAKAEQDGTEYVTDRYLMVRADLAPVPDTYPGKVGQTIKITTPMVPNEATDAPANGMRFREPTIEAIKECGWRLRLIDGMEKRVAVIDRSGSVIGVAISTPQGDNTYWHNAVEYDEGDLCEWWADRAEWQREQALERNSRDDA